MVFIAPSQPVLAIKLTILAVKAHDDILRAINDLVKQQCVQVQGPWVVVGLAQGQAAGSMCRPQVAVEKESKLCGACNTRPLGAFRPRFGPPGSDKAHGPKLMVKACKQDEFLAQKAARRPCSYQRLHMALCRLDAAGLQQAGSQMGAERGVRPPRLTRQAGETPGAPELLPLLRIDGLSDDEAPQAAEQGRWAGASRRRLIDEVTPLRNWAHQNRGTECPRIIS